MKLTEMFETLKYGYILDADNLLPRQWADGKMHEKTDGKWHEVSESQNKGVAAKLREDFNKNTEKYLNTDFRNKNTGLSAKFTGKSQKELRSRTDHTKENGFTIQEHFEVANQIKELFENADLIKEHEDIKHGDKNLRIERFLSKPIKLKSGKNVQACITVKHTVNIDGRLIYSVEAMDIKNALDKTRAKGQHHNGTSPSNSNITQDSKKSKSLVDLFYQLKMEA